MNNINTLASHIRDVQLLPQPRPELPRWKSRRVMEYIESNLDKPIRNDELAGIVHLSRSHFCRAFHNSTGNPPHEYIIRRRIERAQQLMVSTRTPLNQIALECGLVDQAHLARLFRRVVGVTPASWRRSQIQRACDKRSMSAPSTRSASSGAPRAEAMTSSTF